MGQELTKTSKEILLKTNTWKCECTIGIVLGDHKVAPRPNGALGYLRRAHLGKEDFSWTSLEEALERVSDGNFEPHFLG